MATHREPGPGEELVFCTAFRHWKTGKLIVAPPGRSFCFVVKTAKRKKRR